MSSLKEVYPFSTQDGKAIPLDIIRPSGLIYIAFTDSTETPVTIPDNYPIAAMISNVTCLIKFDGSIGSLSPNTVYENLLLLPADTITIVSLTAGIGAVKGVADSGTLYIQLIEKWAGLALDKQFIRK